MTTINNYSVSLALDASSYIRNSSLSRKETQSLIREINSARSPADNYERSLNRLDKALKAGAIDQATYNRLLESARGKLDAASKGGTNYAQSLTRVVAAYVSFRAVKDTIGQGIKLAADAESASVAFRVLLGDARAASDLMLDLKQFAASTPFEFPELRQSAQLLLAFGFGAKEITKELEILGNIAAGTNQPIGELAELIGKARVQNTIFSEDLNQLTGRGINVLDGLARRFGTVTDNVKKMASEGKIRFSDLQAVITELGETQFAGLMAEQAKTLNGEISTLKDNLNSIKQDLAQGLLPLMKSLAESGIVWARQFKTGMEVLRESQGFFDPASGGGLSGQARQKLANEAAELKEMQEFYRQQMERRRKGLPTIRTSKEPSKIGPLTLSDLGSAAGGAGGIIGSAAKALFGSASSLATGVAMSVQQSTVAFVESNKELVKSVTDSPAIAALEVGSQEAYQFLTQSNKEAVDEQTRAEAAKKARDERAEEQRKKQLQWLETLNNTLEMNGFSRIR